MLYTTLEQRYMKNMLCNTATQDAKPSFGSNFSSLSNWFSISSSKNAQETGPLHLETTKKSLHIFHSTVTFIMQNQRIHSIRICASYRVDMGKDEFNSNTAKGIFTIRGSYRFWCGVCSGHRAGIDMPNTVSGGLKWGCGITDNILAKLVCALPFCIPPSTQLSLMVTMLNLLVSMVRHLTTKTWDQCNKQICGSSSRGSMLIYHFMSIMVAISLHSLLALLVTLQWIATMHRKWVSSSNSRWLAKLRGFQNWRGRLRLWLQKPWLAAPFAWARGNSEPPAEQNDLFLKASTAVICPVVWFVPFYFSIKFPCIAQLRQPCKYCWHHWYKLHPNWLQFYSRDSMVATWPRWLSEPSVPLIMKYTSCVHHIMCHGKQDAKVIFDGYNQQLSTKSVEQARKAPKKIFESISVDRNMPTTTSQADFLSNAKKKKVIW